MAVASRVQPLKSDGPTGRGAQYRPGHDVSGEVAAGVDALGRDQGAEGVQG